jgi:predicted kinase
MQKLVLLGGPTGVGKSTALKLLQYRLPKSALLDADDVWRVSKDLAVESNRAVALANVIAVVRGYFVAGCETAVLSWVFARPELYAPVIAGLENDVDAIHQIYLTASPDDLRQRLEKRNDVDRLDYAISRLRLIEDLPFPKIDTTGIGPAQVADLLEREIRAL